VAYDLGIIPRSVFFMLVVMAVVTTYMTSPILRRLIRRTDLEPYFRVSTFARESPWT
jgi:predicted PurR-regulated permease PerM